MTTSKCTRRGCGQDFDPANNAESACSFHPGAPVFHEGLKSWSCCSSTNKPVLSFDEFMEIPGCATGSHSLEKPVQPAQAAPTGPVPVATGKTADGKEVYGGAVPGAESSSASAINATAVPAPLSEQFAGDKKPLAPKSTPYVEEQDDPDIGVPSGARCKRKACGKEYEGGSREGEVCEYHPGMPIFHEGSKGYSCCKRRVLDFDDFLAIQGCRRGRHLFVGPKRDMSVEEQVQCRTDHYQTPSQVIVSIFAKNITKDVSAIDFEADKLSVNLVLPENRRFTRAFELFGPIDPSASKFRVLPMKCEITLAKADGRSWPSIEKPKPEHAGMFVPQLTFSAGGGRGTTGATEAVLDGINKMRASS